MEHPENEEEGPAKRFCIINQQQQFQLEIPRDMTEYGNSHFNVFFFFFRGRMLRNPYLHKTMYHSISQEVKRMDEYTRFS